MAFRPPGRPACVAGQRRRKRTSYLASRADFQKSWRETNLQSPCPAGSHTLTTSSGACQIFAARARIVSGAQIPLNRRKSARHFKAIFWVVISEFESSQSSHPVRSPPPDMLRPLKIARHRGISEIWLGLRVRKVATEVPIRRFVSEAIFWRLVFGAMSLAIPVAGRDRYKRAPWCRVEPVLLMKAVNHCGSRRGHFRNRSVHCSRI
jgi:hypothetical protein